MKRLADRFAQQSMACQDLDQLRKALAETTIELGFSYFALLHHAGVSGASGRYLRLDNYPGAWREHFLRQGYGLHDPVHFASRRSGAAFCWTDLSNLVRLDAAQLKVLEQSRDYGLGDGFTVPVNVFGEPAGSCSFAAAEGAALPTSRLSCAALIGLAAFQAGRRLLRGSGPVRRVRLSRREAECLRLVADGKTDWEVAAILGLSEETVRGYIKRARSAYDVVSRTQLALKGLEDGWVEWAGRLRPR